MNDASLAAQFRTMISQYHQARAAAAARRYDQPVPLHPRRRTRRPVLMTRKETGMDLTPQDRAAIAALTSEIMHLVDNYCGRYPAALQQDVTDLLTTRITEATRAYDAQLDAEETHSTDQAAKHHISDCTPGYCGRCPGQRR